MLAQLVSAGRLRLVKRSTDAATRKKLNQLIRNKRDRTYVLVAGNSASSMLCSHDFTDFPPKKRLAINKVVGVEICYSAQAARKL